MPCSLQSTSKSNYMARHKTCSRGRHDTAGAHADLAAQQMSGTLSGQPGQIQRADSWTQAELSALSQPSLLPHAALAYVGKPGEAARASSKACAGHLGSSSSHADTGRALEPGGMMHQGSGQGNGSGHSNRGPGMVHSSEAAVSSEVQTSTKEGLAEMMGGQAEHAGRHAEWQQADFSGSLPRSVIDTHGAASTATLQLESSVDQQSALVYSLDVGVTYPDDSHNESHQQADSSLHALLQASGADAESQHAAAQHSSDNSQPEEAHGSRYPTDGFSSLREHALPDMSDDSAASQVHSAGSAPVSAAQHSAAASRPSGRSDELRSSAGSTGSQRFGRVASQSASQSGSAPGSGPESPHSSGLSGSADVPIRQAQALPISSIPMHPKLSLGVLIQQWLQSPVHTAPQQHYHSICCVLFHCSALSGGHTVAGMGNRPASQRIWLHF